MSGYYEDMDSATLLRISFISLKLASVKSDQPGYPVAGRINDAIDSLMAFVQKNHPEMIKDVQTAIHGVETVTNSRKGRPGL